MKKTSQRPSIVLDAGYVSIKAFDRCRALNIIGLHGKRLCCVILTVFILFCISSINLTVRRDSTSHWMKIHLLLVSHMDYVQIRSLTFP